MFLRSSFKAQTPREREEIFVMAHASSSEWREVSMAGRNPWQLRELQICPRRKLWSSPSSLVSACDLNFSRLVLRAGEVVAGQPNSLVTLVQLLLMNLKEGELLSAQFRLHRAKPERTVFEGTLSLPPFPAACAAEGSSFLDGASIELTKELREDQKAALQLLMQREAQPSSQAVTMEACMDVPVEELLQVGHTACLRPGAPLSVIPARQVANLRKLSIADCQKVLTQPGTICSIADKHATLSWETSSSCAPRSGAPDATYFFADVNLSHVMPRPSSKRQVAVGATVALVREDPEYLISTQDAGVLLMLEQETATVLFPQHHQWKGPVSSLVPTSAPFFSCLEVKLVVRYPLRGSICAQKMGWGKTALVVALLRHSYQETLKFYDARERSLVVVPPKVFGQWKNEMVSWLGLRKAPERNVYETTSGGMKLIFCLDSREAKQIYADGSPEASVVLLPSSIFCSKSLDSGFETWLYETPWTRVVLDEAHEIASLPDVTQRALSKLSPRFTLLLTGTPQQGPGALGAARLAWLMGVSLCIDDCSSSSNFYHNRDLTTNCMAARFLGSTAISQESPFHVPVEQRLVRVELSKAEAVIYENFRAHQERAPTTRQLLELCSHFTQEGGTTANQEIATLIDQRSTDLRNSQTKVRSHASMIVFLARGLRDTGALQRRLERATCPPREPRKEAWGEGKRDLQACIQGLLKLSLREILGLLPSSPEHVRGVETWNLLSHLARGSGGGGEAVSTEQLLAPWIAGVDEQGGEQIFSRWEPIAADAFKEQLNQYLTQDFVEVGVAKRSLDFLTRSLRELRETGGSCPVCLDDLQNGEATCMPQCGHSFHEGCLSSSARVKSSCPTCRQEVSGIYCTRAADPWPKYGTKIKTVIETLKRIMLEFPGERALVYVQFKNMRQKLELAFKEFKVPFLTLSGSARTQGNSIDRWQNGRDDSDFVMMLSCEEHNSGITLTRAR